MFRHLFKKKEETALDVLVDDILLRMAKLDPYSEEYTELMNALERLYKLKVGEQPRRVSGDTFALIVGNLVGIVIVVAYEQKHVITSKAFAQILRPKTPTTD